MKTHSVKKKVKHGLAGKVSKKVVEKKLNPFEVRVTKQKFHVLGRKSQHEPGRPGISRAMAIKKREHTLLLEYRKKNKANMFIDKRIGELNKSMDPEEKMMARFAAEKAKYHEKKSIYNLGEEETLTHYGQSVSEIEKFDDPRSDDDEEEEEDKLGATFVSEAHFGGGMLENNTESKGNKPKSREDIIQELIADSKQRKADKQKERQDMIQLTEKLDTDWKNLKDIVSESKRKKDDEAELARKLDSYDISVRELQFEARGKATDKLKSPETIAKEEKERLEKLEHERQQRMMGMFTEKVEKSKHRSADELDTDFFDLEDEEFCLSYKDGILIGQDKLFKQNKDEDMESENKEVEETAEETEAQEEEEEEDDDDDDDDDNDDEMEEEDDYSDIESEESEDVDETSNDKNLKDERKGSTEKKDEREKVKEKRKEDIKEDLQKRKAVMEEARKELPYTFKAPESYEELTELFEKYNAEDIGIITERIIKCHHPGLGQGNTEKLGNLFIYLLQFVQDCVVTYQDETSGKSEKSNAMSAMKIIHGLVPYLYDLSKFSPQDAARCMLDVIMEKQEEFKKAGEKQYPGLETFVFLKLAAILFPSSDFRHMVMTPAMIFMMQALSQCKVNSRKAVAAGLAMCTLFVEFTSLSKRYCPEVVNFLQGVLYISLPKNSTQVLPTVPPFRPVGQEANLLVLKASCSSFPVKPLEVMEVQTDAAVDDEFCVQALSLSVKLLKDVLEHYRTLPAAAQIFSTVKEYLSQIPVENYPESVREDIKCLGDEINNLEKKKLQVLQKEKKKPRPLKLYEPEIEEHFNPFRKSRKGSDAKLEHDRLLHMYKREFKGARRELRKDNAFLARQQLKEQLERDSERKQKVKELMASLANQEGEYNKMVRENELLEKKKRRMK